VQTVTNKTQVITVDGWTMRVRLPSIENPNILLMIHGITGDENSMWVFGRKFSNTNLILAPRAPYPAHTTGFSWRDLTKYPLHADFGKPHLEMLFSSAEALIKLTEAYSESLNIEAHQIDVVGFSQGGAMVNVLGLLYPNRIRKMAVLAGFIPYGLDTYIAEKSLAGKKILVAHGTQDETVTLDRAQASVQLLQAAGAEVDFVQDEVGHKLGANGMQALEEYFAD
jgi:phospholipase/carboxylesterase